MTDLINGLFELFGGFFILLSIRKTYLAKKVEGVSFWHIAFFNSWGFWNLWFYPAYDAWLSFFGGIGVAITNTIWSCQFIYYRGYVGKIRRWLGAIPRPQFFMPYAIYQVDDRGE